MTDDLARIFAASLAAHYLGYAWLHSPLPPFLRGLRARAEVGRDLGRWWGDLLTCPTCLSFWLAMVLVATTYAGEPGRLFVAILAAAGAAVLMYR